MNELTVIRGNLSLAAYLRGILYTRGYVRGGYTRSIQVQYFMLRTLNTLCTRVRKLNTHSVFLLHVNLP